MTLRNHENKTQLSINYNQNITINWIMTSKTLYGILYINWTLYKLDFKLIGLLITLSEKYNIVKYTFQKRKIKYMLKKVIELKDMKI